MWGCSPLFGGNTQYGSNASNAYPGQFNFWADVRPWTLMSAHPHPISSGPFNPQLCSTEPRSGHFW